MAAKEQLRNNHAVAAAAAVQGLTASQQHQLAHAAAAAAAAQGFDSLDLGAGAGPGAGAGNPLYLGNASQSHFQSRNSSKKLKCPKCNWHYKYK